MNISPANKPVRKFRARREFRARLYSNDGLMLEESYPRPKGERYRERSRVFITFQELDALAAKYSKAGARE